MPHLTAFVSHAVICVLQCWFLVQYLSVSICFFVFVAAIIKYQGSVNLCMLPYIYVIVTLIELQYMFLFSRLLLNCEVSKSLSCIHNIFWSFGLLIWFPAQRLTQSPLHPQKLKSKSMLISWWNLVIVWHMAQNTWFARTFWPTINPHWCIARVTRLMMRSISVSSASSSTYTNTFAWPDVLL